MDGERRRKCAYLCKYPKVEIFGRVRVSSQSSLWYTLERCKENERMRVAALIGCAVGGSMEEPVKDECGIEDCAL